MYDTEWIIKIYTQEVKLLKLQLVLAKKKKKW